MTGWIDGIGRSGDATLRVAGLLIVAVITSGIGGSDRGGSDRGGSDLGGRGGGRVPAALLTAPGVTRVTAPAGAPAEALVSGATAFGYNLARTGEATSTNWLASPLSVEYAFAMARAGAGGTTATEMDSAFGFPAAGLPEAFNALTRQMAAADAPPSGPRATSGSPLPPELSLGNGLFTQRGFPVGAAFLQTLAQQYGSGVYPVDFLSPSAIQTINRWVERQTAGRVHNVFDHLSADTRLVLANTVYLRADWRTGFVPAQTGSAGFTRADGRVVTVPMMHGDVDAQYATGPGWRALQLPFVGDLAMRILIPDAGGGPSPTALLSPVVTAAATVGMRPAYVDLAMPRWKFSSSVDLSAVLPGLGVRAAFGPGADFSAIAPGLRIGQAVHRATITVDERGTEAAAVTGLGMLASARTAPAIHLRLDRPFAFSIVHVPTGTPVFIGRVGDPTATGGS
jgi:serine protease inhibitor